MARPTKVTGVALAELVRVPERSQGRLVESGITQVRRIKLAQDNGLEKASLPAQTGAPGNTRGHGIEREADQGVASTILGVRVSVRAELAGGFWRAKRTLERSRDPVN